MFSGLEVLSLDGFLGGFYTARDQAGFDGHALFHPKTLQQARNPLLGEDAHQVIFKSEIETRGTGVALTAGASAQLIVDAA